MADSTPAVVHRWIDAQNDLDEIVGETCITHDGDVIHPVTRRAMELEEDE